jgi:orotate phosphoribosyltransferase
MTDDIRIALLTAIREKAYREGDFTLASGQKSTYYIDCKEVTLDADGARLVGEAIFSLVSGWNVDAVGGMELGSVPISTAVSVVSAQRGAPLANVIVRKQEKGHGTGKKIEGRCPPGARIAVVEDVVSTGGSSLKAIAALREAGIEVAGVTAIVDRQMGGAEAFAAVGVPFTPLFTIADVRAG